MIDLLFVVYKKKTDPVTQDLIFVPAGELIRNLKLTTKSGSLTSKLSIRRIMINMMQTRY